MKTIQITILTLFIAVAGFSQNKSTEKADKLRDFTDGLCNLYKCKGSNKMVILRLFYNLCKFYASNGIKIIFFILFFLKIIRFTIIII